MTPKYVHLTVFAAALGLCLVLTPLVRWLAVRWGLVDAPDGKRKIHARPIPVAGGVAVLFTTLIVLTALLFVSDLWRTAVESRWLQIVGLAVAAVIIASVGVIDDFRSLRVRHKVLGQLLAIAVVIACGVEISKLRLFDRTWVLSWWFAIPVTVFWLLGAINSLNLIDGMDGLLGSLGFIICASLAVLAQINSHLEMALIATALAGSLLGFLFYNFPPATIFLGDGGSMLVGLVVGVLAIESSLKGAATVALTVPAALLVIPILDTSAAIVRRGLSGRSVFATDRGHLHHVLLGGGWSDRGVLLLVGGLSLMASLVALASLLLNNELAAVLAILAVAWLLVVTRLFGHVEFLLIKERVLAVFNALRYGPEHGRTDHLEVQLQGSAEWNALWKQVTAQAEQLDLQSVALNVSASAFQEGYRARWGRVQSHEDNAAFWQAEIPLTADGQVAGRLTVTGLRDHEPVWDQIVLVGKIVDDIETALAILTVPASSSESLDLNGLQPEADHTPVPPVDSNGGDSAVTRRAGRHPRMPSTARSRERN